MNSTHHTLSEELPSDIDVWVLAGQSNIQGAGRFLDALQAHASIWAFSSAGHWTLGEDPLHRHFESYTPVNQRLQRRWLTDAERALSDAELAKREAGLANLLPETKSDSKFGIPTLHETSRAGGGVGPGLAFAQAMHAATGRPIGLIAAAHGGTTLDEWNPALKSQGTDSLYGALLDRIARAGGNLRGVLWYQGESDAIYELACTYGDRLAAWIATLRTDLGRPDLPVIMVQPGRFVAAEPLLPAVGDTGALRDAMGWNRMRWAVATLPDRVPSTAATSAIDLGMEDFVHLNTAAQHRLGKRLARVALALEQGLTVGPRLVSITVKPVPGWAQVHALRLAFTGLADGGWSRTDNFHGFTVHRRDGSPHPTLTVVDVSVSPESPATMRVLLNGLVDTDCALAYGWGRNPCADVTDAADLPLPAFEPVPVEPTPTFEALVT